MSRHLTWAMLGVVAKGVLAQAASGVLAQAATPPPAAMAAPATTAVPADTAVLSPADEILKLRDPFKRPDIGGSKAIAKTELETYSVDTFKLVAVVTGPSKMRAMLLSADNKTFLVHVGMKIGTRSGVIQKITAESVEVRERIVNVLGQEENVDSEITLQADSKNGPGGLKAAR